MADVIGQWRKDHIRSLNRLCTDALKPRIPPGGLLSDPIPTSAEIDAAQRTLHKHPIYRWLEQRDPPVLRQMPQGDPLAEFRLVQILLHRMTIAFAESSQTPVRKKRMDKPRAYAWDAFDRAEKYLLDGTVVLSSPARHSFLIELLGEAKSESVRKYRRAPRAGEGTYPVLEGLAYALYKELGLADAALIMAVAKAVDSGCSAKTAKRFVDKAKLP